MALPARHQGLEALLQARAAPLDCREQPALAPDSLGRAEQAEQKGRAATRRVPDRARGQRRELPGPTAQGQAPGPVTHALEVDQAEAARRVMEDVAGTHRGRSLTIPYWV